MHTTPPYSLPVSQVEGLDVLTQGWASLSLHLPSPFPLASVHLTLSLEVTLAVDSWVLQDQGHHQADDPPASQDPLGLSSPEHP